MEKRQKTLARTLSWATHGAKLTLFSPIFLPILLTVQPDLFPLKRSAYPVPAAITEVDLSVTEAPRPKDLVKVYSILKSHRPDISEQEAWSVSAVIRQEAVRYGLDPMLVLAVIRVESRFKYDAVSPVGARGIMQIMPYVAKGLLDSGIHREYSHGFTPEYLDDPVFNIKLGVYYLHDLKKSFRHLNTALVAYNLGPTELRNRLDNDIEYSDEYAVTVLSTYQKYKKAKPPTF